MFRFEEKIQDQRSLQQIQKIENLKKKKSSTTIDQSLKTKNQ